MIILTKRPRGQVISGLWFVIPDELQHKVIPWLKSKLYTLDDGALRKHYRNNVLSRRAALEANTSYGHAIFAKVTSILGSGSFCFYTFQGHWRVSDCEMYKGYHERAKAEILKELTEFQPKELRF